MCYCISINSRRSSRPDLNRDPERKQVALATHLPHVTVHLLPAVDSIARHPVKLQAHA